MQKILLLSLLILLNNSFNKLYGQTELVNNGTFSTTSSWDFAYKSTPNTTGAISISGGTLNCFVDNNGNFFPFLDNNILGVNTTSFTLFQGETLPFSIQIRKSDAGFAANLSWVLIDSGGSIVQFLGSYTTRSGSGTGTVLTTSNMTYNNSITFTGNTGTYRIALYWISFQPGGTGSGNVDDVFFDNVSLQSSISLGVDDVKNKKDKTVQMYLNPPKDAMTIFSKHNLKSYTIFDQTGRVVTPSTSIKGTQQEINLSYVEKGNYVISIETENERVNKKFIK
ncbi:T9SS C-terminal target domain-containing protein [Chryseobacterium nematophagum]|uniref:T9SS C-terminal target domain-containing protein n=1 Tax=Chryseobacterium nematophagum TaxID=2305228 RepID=A0A3M7TIJ1_9FLAO|nr:T9SS type A sorting domain-containing protein [Chryseobacterium nematophagum]RNA62826.1 T9SS C-terminal target domain-containing protein [Chryseobacterium nematophagum]